MAKQSIFDWPEPGDLGKKGSASAEEFSRTGMPDDVLQRLALLRPPVEEGEARIRWGRPARFELTEPEADDDIGVEVTWPDDEGEQPPPDVVIRYHDEVARTEEDVRVENPDDPEQYVIVRRVVSIVFQNRADGSFDVFNFTNPEQA